MTNTYDPVGQTTPATTDTLDALTEQVMARLEERLQPLFGEHIEQGKRQLAFELRSQFAALSMSAAGELLRLRKDHRQALAQEFADEREAWHSALAEARDGQVRALREETVTAAEDALAAVAAQWLNESRSHLEREAESQIARLAGQLLHSTEAQLQTRFDELFAAQQQTVADTLTTLTAEQFTARSAQLQDDFVEQLKHTAAASLTLIRDSVQAEGGGMLWELQQRLEKSFDQTRDTLRAQFDEVARTAVVQFEQQLSERQTAAAQALEGVWNAWAAQQQQQFEEQLAARCEQQIAAAMQPQQALLAGDVERLRSVLAEQAQADLAIHAQAEAERLTGDLENTVRAGIQSQLATWRSGLDTTLATLTAQLHSLSEHAVTADGLDRELVAVQSQLTALSEQLNRLTQSTKSVVQRLQTHTQARLATLQEDGATLAAQHTQFAELLQQLAAAHEVSAAFVQWYHTASVPDRLLGRLPKPVPDRTA